MPEYVYSDGAHRTTVTHRMLYSTAVVCTTCGDEMWRVPQAPYVTWGGLAPSAGEPAGAVQELIETADERRETFAARHEQHERDTADES